MDQLKLLRDYVTTMQRQVESKNTQIRTLTQQNQRLLSENYQLSLRNSYSLTGTTPCTQCPQTKSQLANLHEVYNLLQSKYEQLEKQKLSASSSSNVRVISTTCTECVQLRKINDEVREKYDEISRKYDEVSRQYELQLQNKSSQSKIYPCLQCPNLRLQLNQKNELITNMKNQLSSFSTKILTLQGQINTLNSTAPKPVVFTQTVSRQSDLERITYLNSQLQQYIALVNSLRSEIKQMSEENYQLVLKVRELEARPREVQFVEKEISAEIMEEIKGLRIQIGELSNDNILLRRQNATLKRQIMNLHQHKSQTFIEVDKPRSSSIITMNDQRRGKHFKKPNPHQSPRIAYYNYQTPTQMDYQQPQLLYQQRVKYDGIQRKIQLLQMENDYLRGTFYSEI